MDFAIGFSMVLSTSKDKKFIYRDCGRMVAPATTDCYNESSSVYINDTIFELTSVDVFFSYLSISLTMGPLNIVDGRVQFAFCNFDSNTVSLSYVDLFSMNNTYNPAYSSSDYPPYSLKIDHSNVSIIYDSFPALSSSYPGVSLYGCNNSIVDRCQFIGNILDPVDGISLMETSLTLSSNYFECAGVTTNGISNLTSNDNLFLFSRGAMISYDNSSITSSRDEFYSCTLAVMTGDYSSLDMYDSVVSFNKSVESPSNSLPFSISYPRGFWFIGSNQIHLKNVSISGLQPAVELNNVGDVTFENCTFSNNGQMVGEAPGFRSLPSSYGSALSIQSYLGGQGRDSNLVPMKRAFQFQIYGPPKYPKGNWFNLECLPYLRVKTIGCLFENNVGHSVYSDGDPSINMYTSISDTFVGGNSQADILDEAAGLGIYSIQPQLFIYNSTFLHFNGTKGSAVYARLDHVEFDRFVLKRRQMVECKFIGNVAQEVGAVMLHDIAPPTEGLFSLNTDFEGIMYDIPGATKRVIIDGCQFINNQAVSGGAISMEHDGGYIYINNSAFYGNTARSGGAIFFSTYIVDTLNMSSNVFENNSATDGGAMYFFLSVNKLVDENSVYRNNRATSNGGAISAAEVDQIVLNGGSAFHNSADNQGGFMFITGSSSTICFNSFTMSENEAIVLGGAIYLLNGDSSSSFSIINSTAVRNTAGSIGGAYFLSGSMDHISIHNSTFDSNVCNDYSGGAIAIRANVREINISDSIISRNYAGYQGGGIGIQASSIIGRMRIIDTVVTQNEAQFGAGFSFPSSTNDIQISNSTVTDNISSQKGAIYFDATRFNIGNISIDGSDISRNIGSGLWLSGDVQNVRVHNNTFHSNRGDNGAAIILSLSRTSQNNISSCLFDENTATNQGGALYASADSDVVIVDSIFKSNDASQGGAVALHINGTTKRSGRSAIVTGCTFSNNTANDGNGGGIYSVNALALSDSSFDNNHASVNGTAVSQQTGTLDLSRVNFSSADKVYASPMASVFVNNSTSSDFLLCPSDSQPIYSNGSVICVLKPTNATSALVVDRYINGTNRPLVLGVSIGIGLFVLVVLALAVVLVRRYHIHRGMKSQFSSVDFSAIQLGAAKKSILDWSEFKSVHEIGSGSFGVVYKAEWRELSVAVVDFLREVGIIQGLRAHPNVVTFVGITYPPSPLSLVTEFCEGGSLYNYLRREPVSHLQKLNFIVGIARGMLHLHLEKVIHRDLAVRNILLTRWKEAKVADFGMSREQQNTDEASVTQTSIGPLKWMAPEGEDRVPCVYSLPAAIRYRQYSNKSDVFSFGVLVWEILMVEEPWPTMSPVDVAMQVLNGERLPLDGLDPLYVKIMTDCWQQEPADRPNMGEICSYLDTVFNEGTSTKSMDDEDMKIVGSPDRIEYHTLKAGTKTNIYDQTFIRDEKRAPPASNYSAPAHQDICDEVDIYDEANICGSTQQTMTGEDGVLLCIGDLAVFVREYTSCRHRHIVPLFTAPLWSTPTRRGVLMFLKICGGVALTIWLIFVLVGCISSYKLASGRIAALTEDAAGLLLLFALIHPDRQAKSAVGIAAGVIGGLVLLCGCGCILASVIKARHTKLATRTRIFAERDPVIACTLSFRVHALLSRNKSTDHKHRPTSPWLRANSLGFCLSKTRYFMEFVAKDDRGRKTQIFILPDL
ncbi:hypothetical protein PROFUN_00467 [Planoprotostelium fungivorum]|uniref:Protein kinase domain-containing protein n=1 Tax=Planoprotostelium fungivorum TaxID=1890364 RepID=A0A2P6N0X1_9EUKA|nr:hypothetical protein PROFUN_00467 [Planoprotostelium fungivorum]